MSNTLQFYILARDRPEYLRETLRSVMAQMADEMEVIVSDNSEQENVAKMLGDEFPEIRCIRRVPQLGVFEHHRAIIEEASADLLVMFHDDDILADGYIQTMRGLFEKNLSIAAVCCNAYILMEKRITNELFFTSGTDSYINDSKALLNKYFTLSSKGPAPFPGYMYRYSAIKGLYLDPAKGGKYADVSFLMSILDRGSIYVLRKPFIYYRFHANNGSGKEEVGQRLSLLRYAYSSNAANKKSRFVSYYRYRYWVNWWKGEKTLNHLRWRFRSRIVGIYLIKFTVYYLLTELEMWKKIINAIGRRVY